MNAWNYLNRECQTEWVDGESLALSDCEPETVTCPSFTSDPTKYGQYDNRTVAMAAGSKCDVTIDASLGVARVIFSNSNYLGFEFEGDYLMDDVITINDGGIENLTIYNAAESGPITFYISFSGATALISSAVSIAALSFLSF